VIVDLPLPIAVACHDAGAANHIVAWLRADDIGHRVKPCMEGPAKKIWEDAFPGIGIASSIAEALAGATALLSGTGWASSLEHEARIAAHRSGMRVVAMVDHWANYESRFVRDGISELPEEIWVVDEYAYALAKRTFGDCDVHLKADIYTQQLIAGVPPIAEVHDNQLLCILEPARADWGRGTQGEFQALGYMFDRLEFMGLPPDTIIRLRPHPSDPPGKYDACLARECGYHIVLDQGSLTDSLAKAKWVAGCESFALALALRAGRTVFCTLPPWAPACRLPHSGLIHLKDISPV
jgi:hypothetical protein